MAPSGSRLVSPSPPGPGQGLLGWQQRVPDQATEQAPHFWNGERDQVGAQEPPFSATRKRMTLSMACAKSARVMCRYQPSHLRTS